LTENNSNNKDTSLPEKRKTENKTVFLEDAYPLHDDSLIEDDVSKDPDWKKTPLYNRIQKIQVIMISFQLLLL
jgi:hypothetical protein